MDRQTVTAMSPKEFRRALSNFPTGVVAVTTFDPINQPLAMIIGSFSSISLEPLLVGFWLDRTSQRQKTLRQSPKFCINILAAHQEQICRQISQKGGARLDGVAWQVGANGCPALSDVIARIYCAPTDIFAVGDHDLIVCAVQSVEICSNRTPLLFFRGEFGDYFSTAARLLDRLLEG